MSVPCSHSLIFLIYSQKIYKLFTKKYLIFFKKYVIIYIEKKIKKK
nr:MAG TPA: hypothetical protein [Caudoviricetes sp.]